MKKWWKLKRDKGTIHALNLCTDVEAIEAYRMGVEALRRQRWIPCSERLPENNQRVLAFGRDNRVHDVVWSWPDNAWHDKAINAVYRERFATHWMPLPEPPEAGASRE